MISLLLPTRQRPKVLERMILSAFERAKYPNRVEVVCRVDHDDNSYREMLKRWENVGFVFGPRIRNMTTYWNECFEDCQGDIVCQMNDDVVFRSEAWDVMVEDEFKKFPDHIVMVHGDHLGGYEGRLFGPHPFVHRRWVEIVGRFIDPWYSSDWGDTGINQIANAIGRRRFLPELIMEHMHFSVGKADIDEVTRERLKRHEEDPLERTYWSHLNDRIAAANRLAMAMSPPFKRRIIDADLDFSGNDAGMCPKCQERSTVFVDRVRFCNVCGNHGF